MSAEDLYFAQDRNRERCRGQFVEHRPFAPYRVDISQKYLNHSIRGTGTDIVLNSNQGLDQSVNNFAAKMRQHQFMSPAAKAQGVWVG